MRVVLIEDVDGLGLKGDVVDVADGYGRNYLVPQDKAVKATKGAIQDAERVRMIRAEADRLAMESAEALAESLSEARVVIAARAADEGKLFGSIGVRDIAEAVEKYTGIAVNHRHITLPQPIKDIGLHEITVKPHKEVEFQLSLDVIPA